MRRNVLNITASDVKDAKLTATVTIPAADVDAAIKKAYKDTAKKYRFPGFRAGKAPRPVIDSALGAEATLAQATNDLIAANEPAVLNELDIVPTKNGDYKELDLAKDHEDYTYTVEFSLRPAAELSSFDAVEIEMPPAEVTESEINNQVEMLLNYRATFEDVEARAVEAEDYVTVDLKAVENADNFAAEGRMLIAGSDSNPKEFNEALIGANVDDVKTVTWTDEVEEGEEAETTPSRSPSRASRSATPPSSPTSSSSPTLASTASRPCATPSRSRSSRTRLPACRPRRRIVASPLSPSACSSTRWMPTTSSPSLRSLARTSCPTSLPAA